MLQSSERQPSSFRDPSGFIFTKNGTIYRQVNLSYKKHFDHFVQSGLYKTLADLQWLTPHEVEDQHTDDPLSYLVLRPEPVPFISYAYEWSFDMLRDAALLTLNIQRKALEYGMTLKDATPFNVQWHKGRMIFIDTLSFELFENRPWIAYRQFCEQFLSPLLLMHYAKASLHSLPLAWPEGIPLQQTRRLLPYRSRWSLHVWLHIHLHAKISARARGKTAGEIHFSKQKMINLITSLELLIRKLKTPAQPSNWQHYYEEAGSRGEYLAAKKQLVHSCLLELKGVNTVADLGANEGEFTAIAAAAGFRSIAADGDPYCINHLYLHLRDSKQENIQPLIIDLVNPSPAIGVNNQEREAFLQRLQADLVLALAIVHHLAIGKNIPLDKIASLFSIARKYLIIEFVPKDDPKTQQLLANRSDIFPRYTLQDFIAAFEPYFIIQRQEVIANSERVLLLMKRKAALS